MNKKLITSAVVSVVASTSVSAVTLADKDGFKYDFEGDFQVHLQKDNGTNQHFHINFEDIQLDNKIEYQLDDNLTALGRIKFDFKNSANNTPGKASDVDEAYIGFNYKNITASIGRQRYATFIFGVAEDYAMSSQDDAFGFAKGDDVIALNLVFDRINIGVTTELRAENEASAGNQSHDLLVSYTTGTLRLTAAYQQRETSLHDDKREAYGVSASYNAGFATFAVDYSNAEDDLKVYNLVTSFDVTEQTRLAIGMVNNQPESEEETNEWYTNLTHTFKKFEQVQVFTELSNSDVSESEMGILIGSRLRF